MIAAVPLDMTRGDTPIWNMVASVSGAAKDATGAHIWMTARVAYNSTTFIFQKSVGSGITIPSGTNGAFIVELDEVDTAGLPDYQTALVYSVRVQFADGTIDTVQWGTLTVYPDATKGVP